MSGSTSHPSTFLISSSTLDKKFTQKQFFSTTRKPQHSLYHRQNCSKIDSQHVQCQANFCKNVHRYFILFLVMFNLQVDTRTRKECSTITWRAGAPAGPYTH